MGHLDGVYNIYGLRDEPSIQTKTNRNDKEERGSDSDQDILGLCASCKEETMMSSQTYLYMCVMLNGSKKK